MGPVVEPREQPPTVDATPSGADPAESGSTPRWPGAHWTPGQTFAGRYVVEALLGRGGMGTVWRVRDQMVGETVALKTLHISGDAPERALERFRREVRLARRITSPHVARTHDLGSHEGVHYLTMEYVEGKSLARTLQEAGRLPPERAARVAAQIADGLAAAHAAGVVHRDLKPDNVLVEAATGRVVVTDFGIARALHDADAAKMTAGIVGTPLYMAPEQVAGAPLDERADIYALGLVLFEMLTGAPAFAADTPVAAAVQRLHQPAPDPRSLVPVPDALAEIVLRCLERDPGARFADAASVARALHAAARGTSAPCDGAGRASGAASDARAALSAPVVPSTPPSSGSRAPVAPLLGSDPALAVLPFAYRGPADRDWVASGVRDELIDVLSRTRGLRVLGRGAVHDAGGRDPRTLGAQLGVDFVVDGTLQIAGSRVRVTARLVEVRTGTQIWSERFDAEVEDLLVLEERVAQRIAESLRLGMSALTGAARLPPEALELYLRARRLVRSPNVAQIGQAAAMFEAVIAQAPDFALAYAAHAMSCVRAWFLPEFAGGRDWKAAAEESVARAMAKAPDCAETHFARAQWMSQQGRYREAVQAVRVALGIAPTLPEAHQLLASLQLEAGRATEGLQRIDLALALEPTLALAQLEKARWHGLYGELAVFEEIVRRWEEDPASDGLRGTLMIRVGAFRGDAERLRAGLAAIERSGHPARPHLVCYARIMLAEMAPSEGLAAFRAALQSPASDRFKALVHQMSSEAWGRFGDVERTLEHVRAGAESVLVDLEWVDRCPFLACIRNIPEFQEIRRKVRARCEEIWAA